eukprot:9785121-Alexandrium_andersonii.AAC.1
MELRCVDFAWNVRAKHGHRVARTANTGSCCMGRERELGNKHGHCALELSMGIVLHRLALAQSDARRGP